MPMRRVLIAARDVLTDGEDVLVTDEGCINCC